MGSLVLTGLQPVRAVLVALVPEPLAMPIVPLGHTPVQAAQAVLTDRSEQSSSRWLGQGNVDYTSVQRGVPEVNAWSALSVGPVGPWPYQTLRW